MKNKFIIAAFSLTVLTSLYSCKDIISPSLRKKSITILAPADNFVSKNFSILFWWESVEGADQYNIQIVKPSFVAGQQLILDTTVSGNKFSQTLQPGMYQWRVKGLNNASATDYVTYNLTIDSSVNLTSQTLLLNTPADNYYSKNLTQNFSWLAMPNATEYIFRILNQSNVQIGNSQSVTSTNTSYTFPSEGVYKWRVSALNDQSGSPYSERTITIDTTRPNIPTITFNPLNDTTTIKPVPLSWNINDSNAKFNIQISKDSFLIPASIIVDMTTLDLKFNFTPPVLNKTYYWRILAKDSASNSSVYSSIHRFKVQ